MSLELPKRARLAATGAIGISAMLLLSGCSEKDTEQWKRLAMPVSATKEAPHIFHLWMWAWLAAMVTGVIVWGLMAYVSIRYRRRSADEVPVQTRYNLPIEIFYTIAPVMMVIVFFFFTVKEQDASLHNFSNPDRTITVVGQQWGWTFNYNYDSGKRESTGNTVYDGSTPANPGTLYLVKGEKTEFHLYSPDVIHSFWVPAFLFKMDVVPGRDNHFGLTPNRTGTFEGRCAELCGVYHSRMLFKVKVVDRAEFDAHLAALAKQGNTGPALGGAKVTEQPGQESTGGESQ